MENITMEDPINDEVLFKVTAFALNRADVLYYQVSTQPNLFSFSNWFRSYRRSYQIGDKVTHFKVEIK
jgi:NADPH:quinone reductase-like Zn-dependent oxidoreductase